METPVVHQAQIVLPSKDLPKDMSFFSDLGFRLDKIYPSDDPQVAMVSGHGLHIRLDKAAQSSLAVIHILSNSPDLIFSDKKELIAPNGTKIKLLSKAYPLEIPPTVHKFEVKCLKESSPWVIGRAGMLYRNLIPSRLGGSIIASHIHIPQGGSVPDSVHYHTIQFQLIYCYKGWVKVVYEDQGEPFVLYPNDCVIQPPEIRHRVLEASDDLQVVEIGVPAEHMTTLDHNMELPTKVYRPEREFQGQKFCHSIAKEATWSPWKFNGFEFRDTGICTATKGVASVHVARLIANVEPTESHTSHMSDIQFTFVLKGKTDLSADGYPRHALNEGDAFVMPPNVPYSFSDYSNSLELLEVSLPGNSKARHC